jgi:acetyltransferase EpsM
MTNVLIGAGGHANVVYEISLQNGIRIDGFIDPKVQFFKSLKKMKDEEPFKHFFIGIGGSKIEELEKRHLLYQNYKLKNCLALKLLSHSAIISETSSVGEGTLIAHNAVLQPETIIGENVIINTGAIIEHDAIIEDGVHVGPGAIVLGGAKIGKMSMIGAGAVILPNQKVAPKMLIASLNRYRNDQ